MNTIKWFFFQYFQNLSWIISNLFTSIFIWQKTENLDYLYKYYLFLFAVIPLSGLLGAVISKRVTPKLCFIISFSVNALCLLIAGVFPDYFLREPIIFGVLNGTAIGLYAVPSNSSMQDLFAGNLSKISARLSAAHSLNSLIIPLFGSYWLYQTGGYSGVFILGALFLLLSVVFTFITHFPRNQKYFEFGSFRTYLPNIDVRKLCYLHFILGIKSGLEWAVFGVVILKLVGGQIGDWGLINFASAAAAIVAGLIYSKFIAGKTDALFLLLSSIIFTALGIILISKFNLINFIIYFLGTSVISTFMNSPLTRLTGDVFSLSLLGKGLSEEFYSFIEFPLALGRIIPILLLWYAGSNLEGDFTLISIFFVVSTIPLISTFIIQRMIAFKAEAIS
jgi:MFS family permease